MCHAHAPPTYACKCICICVCIRICVTGNSQKHKSQICRMPHGDTTQPTRGRLNEEQEQKGQERQEGQEGLARSDCEGLRTATGNWLRHIHITGMARRHLATHSHVTHDLLPLPLSLCLPLLLCLSRSPSRYPNHLKTLARHLGATPQTLGQTTQSQLSGRGSWRSSREGEGEGKGLLQQLIHSDCVHTHGLG